MLVLYLIFIVILGLVQASNCAKQYPDGIDIEIPNSNLIELYGKKMMIFASLPYCINKQLLTKFMNVEKNTDNYFIKYIGDADSYILRNGTTLIIGFAGTDFTKFDDLIADIKSMSSIQIDDNHPNIYVGTGYLLHLNKVYPKIVSDLRNNSRTNGLKRVIITGHSLGGAMAQIAAFKLYFENIFNNILPEVVTFGQPIVGNSIFTKEVLSKSSTNTRFVSQTIISSFWGFNDIIMDIITTIPFVNGNMFNCSSILCTWDKIGKEIITKGGCHMIETHGTYYGFKLPSCDSSYYI